MLIWPVLLSSRTIGGQGIYHEFASQRILRSLKKGYSKIVTRTQNPKIEITIRESLDSLVQRGQIKGYDFEREKILGIYGRKLTDNIPLSHNAKTNLLYSALNYEVGDAFKLTFNIKL